MDHPEYRPARRLRQPYPPPAVEFRSWQDATSSPPAHGGCSPNLLQLRIRLEERWPGWKVLGCYSPRAVRGGVSKSSHAFGAAIDLSYKELGRERLDLDVLPYLIGWSHPWHIQAIHDYVGSRIWRAGRTSSTDDADDGWWRAQRSDAEGMGKDWATWVHIEVTRDGWGDARVWDERGAG